MNFTEKELRRNVQKLYKNVDDCITELVNARLKHNEFAEGKALFTMEHLMVATEQMLGCIDEYFYNIETEELKSSKR